MELHQRSLFEKRSFYIEDEALRCIVRDSSGETEVYINYEDLTNVVRNHFVKNSRLFFIALSFSVFSIAGVLYSFSMGTNIRHTGFWIAIAVVIGLFYQITKKQYKLINLNNDKALFIIKNKPSKSMMNHFIDELFAKRKAYLRENYYYIDGDNSREKELSRLNWLLKEKVITNDEYQFAKDELA